MCRFNDKNQTTCYRSRFEYLDRWNTMNRYQTIYQHRRSKVGCFPGCQSYGPRCAGKTTATYACCGRSPY